MLGQSVHRFFTPEDVAAGRVETEMRNAIQFGHGNDERWHVTKDGRRLWASGEMMPLKSETGEIIGFLKIFRDRSEQKSAESDLRRKNELLENEVVQRTRERDRLWRISLDLFLVIASDGMLLDANPAASILGYEPRELRGQHFGPFVHPDDIGRTLAAIAQTAQAPVAHFEVRLRHKNGSFRWFAWSAVAENGVIHANGRDITLEKRQAELVLLASDERLQLALDAGGMGAWEWNISTGTVTWWPGMDTVHGLAPGSTIRIMEEYAGFVHPDDRPQVMAAVTECIDTRHDLLYEYRIICPGGAVRWIEVRGRLVFDEAGNPAKLSGLCVDITRRKRTEQDLRFLAEASAELAGLIDYQSTLDKVARLAVPAFADWCAVDILEQDGTLNRVAVAHVDPEKVRLAHEFHRRYPPDPTRAVGTWNIIRSGRGEYIPEIPDALLEQSTRDAEHLAAVKELGLKSYIGAPLALRGKTLGAITFVTAESGRIYNADDLALAEDLTRRAAISLENANLYRKLQDSDRAKDVFLATLAHELRNPLAPIANALSIIKITGLDKARIMQVTEIMERQVTQLTRLVDDLMDVSRITTGKIELQREHTDLATVVKNAIETSRPHIDAADHKLTVTFTDQPASLYADPVRLAQVFSNMLNNAAKYTRPGGRIDVIVESTDDHFVVRIKDTGTGIQPAMLRKIFTIFTQVSHPLERSQGGLGIGLSLVDGLVRLHGGTVEAHSDGLDKGSEFTVRLPRVAFTEARQADSQPDKEGRPAAAPTGSGMRRILVVDDNVDAAKTVAEILTMLGNEVSVVYDGLAAVQAAVDLMPDIVLLDIGLPGIDGYEVARRIRSTPGLADMQLIALTGWGQQKDRQWAVEAGFSAHWVKPVQLEKLQEISARR
ncbi:MAG: putative histidine kinase, hybrid [Herminiimonas sp.]|nr:putative histidine kinase, hybrid [Herminiimonas sp.]